jgi:hypothetical protein
VDRADAPAEVGAHLDFAKSRLDELLEVFGQSRQSTGPTRSK